MTVYSNYSVASADGIFNGSTRVTVLGGPGSGAYTIRYLNIQQSDSVAQTVTVEYDDNGTYRLVWSGTLQPGDTLVFGEEDCLVLDASTKSITVKIGGAATTTNPVFVVSYSIQS